MIANSLEIPKFLIIKLINYYGGMIQNFRSRQCGSIISRSGKEKMASTQDLTL